MQQCSGHTDQAKPQEQRFPYTIRFCKYWAKGPSCAGVCICWFSQEQSLHGFAGSCLAPLLLPSVPVVGDSARDRWMVPRVRSCPELSTTAAGSLSSLHQPVWDICSNTSIVSSLETCKQDHSPLFIEWQLQDLSWKCRSRHGSRCTFFVRSCAAFTRC